MLVITSGYIVFFCGCVGWFPAAAQESAGMNFVPPANVEPPLSGWAKLSEMRLVCAPPKIAGFWGFKAEIRRF